MHINTCVSSCVSSQPSGVVVRGAGCYTKGPGFESRVRHGCQTVRPRSHQWLRSKTDRRDLPGLFLGRASRPSRSEFFVVFLLKSRKYGLGSLRKTPTEGNPPIGLGPS